jgi:hypothetical protein
MAGAYIVTLPLASGKTLRDNTNMVVVHAEDAAQAKEAAAALYGGDAPWSEATATAIAAGDYSGWTVRVRLYDPDDTVPLVPVVDVSVLGDATTNTIDEVAAALVTALNATTPISNAAYNSTTQVLTVAAIADGLGDHILQVEFTHPDFAGSIDSLFTTVVDEGIAGADVTVTFRGDTYVTPKLYGKGTQR